MLLTQIEGVVAMKLLIASSQPSLYQWIGAVLDSNDVAVLSSSQNLVSQFNCDRYDSVIIDITGISVDDMKDIMSQIRAIATRRWIPIILLSSEMNQEQLSSMFKAGADDIILTSYPSWLLKAKLDALGRVEQIQSELQVAMDRIEQLSLVDSVTQLPNYRGVMNESVRLYGQSNRDDAPFGAVMIEVDFFDRYVGEHGHDQAQELFRTLAMLVEGSSCRPLDFVGRFDEGILVLLLPETDEHGTQKVGKEVLRHVREANLPFANSPSGNVVTVSVATYAYIPDVTSLSVEQIFGKLKQGLHQAQTAGYDHAFAV